MISPQGGLLSTTMESAKKKSGVKESVVHRLKIIHGHLEKIIKMVESGQYCIDILHQSLAVQAALKSTDQVILENHMKTCVARAIKAGKTDEVIGEVMKVMEKKHKI